jgi:hypothetical protein
VKWHWPEHSIVLRVLIIVSMFSIARSAYAASFSPEELQAALQSAGVQKVFRLQTFETPKSEYILVYGGIADGEVEVLVFRDNSLRAGHTDLRLDWRSGILPKELLVMVEGGPEIQPIVTGDTVILISGCMPHNCGSRAGAMAYSVDHKELFKATYDSSSQPALKYSANGLVEKNSIYKQALDSTFQDHNVKQKGR